MFERDVMKTSLTSKAGYTPKMITFYTYWTTGIHGYLSLLHRSIKEFRELNVDVYFGLVDLNDETSDSRKSKTFFLIYRHVLICGSTFSQ
jgi:hypothetical protein